MLKTLPKIIIKQILENIFLKTYYFLFFRIKNYFLLLNMFSFLFLEIKKQF